MVLPEHASIVEIGCGKGELLVRLLLANPTAAATGIDWSSWFLADARARAGAAGVADRLALGEEDAAAWLLGRPALADLAISMGASGAIATHAQTLAALVAVTRPGGAVLFGDGVWTGEPPVEGMASFGMARDELPEGLEGQRDLGAPVGLVPAWSELVSVDEWDAYEAEYAGGIERWASENAGDPDRESFLRRAAGMRESYAGWRRGVFGFGITLFQLGAGAVRR